MERQIKSRKQKSKRDLLILIIPAAAILIVCAAVWLIVSRKDKSVLTENYVQYYAGSSFQFSEGAGMVRTEEGTTVMEHADATPMTLPVYSTSRTALKLPVSYLYYNPRTLEKFEIPYYSELELANGNVLVTKDGKTKALTGGFLYDGKDIYIFLEPMVLKLNDREYALSALSYAEAMKGGDLMLFDYETKEMASERPQGAVRAYSEGGEYCVSLLNGSMTDTNGERWLLPNNPGLAPDIFD